MYANLQNLANEQIRVCSSGWARDASVDVVFAVVVPGWEPPLDLGLPRGQHRHHLEPGPVLQQVKQLTKIKSTLG